jgi:glutamyl-tRNA reductase
VTVRAGSIAAFVTHARDVPVSERERFAREVRARVPGRGLVLETCHRVEAYTADPELAEALQAIRMPVGGRRMHGPDAIGHVIAVAVGRDSVVVGEDQVLHQLRAAFDDARATGLSPALERLLTVALRSGRVARSWRQGPGGSLASLALSTLEERVGPLAGRSLLVIGAGRMGRLAARAAAGARATVTVANRSEAAARALAHEIGADVAPLDPGAAIAAFEAVLVAVGGIWSISDATASVLAAASPPVVDLSVPPAITASLARRLGSALITADDLARIDVAPSSADRRAAVRLDALIAGATSEVVAWLDGQDRRATAAELARRAAEAREAELRALWRRLPELDPPTRQAIEAMAGHLAQQLLRAPLEHLNRDVDGAAEQAVREVFAL